MRRRSGDPIFRVNNKLYYSERERDVKATTKSSTLDNWGKDVQSDNRLYEQYKMLIDGIIDELEGDLQRYKENPQSHPLYPSEWDKFWEKRSNELEAGTFYNSSILTQPKTTNFNRW